MPSQEASDLLTDHVSLPHIGLPLTGSHYQRRKDEMKAETNKEYNEFLKGVFFFSLNTIYIYLFCSFANVQMQYFCSLFLLFLRIVKGQAVVVVRC